MGSVLFYATIQAKEDSWPSFAFYIAGEASKGLRRVLYQHFPCPGRIPLSHKHSADHPFPSSFRVRGPAD